MARYATTAVFAILPYLIGAFVAWDLDVQHWLPAGRFLLAMFTLLSAVGCYTCPVWSDRK